MSKSEHYTTAPEDRIPITYKSAYAIGMLVNNMQAAALPAMMVILNLGLGMNPALVGLIAFIPRIVDALTDPMMGYISDNTRSRFGRRRPYIFWGAISAGIIFALMWQLYPGYSQSFYFWFFLIASILFFCAYTVYATPFVALGFEMSPDYHERTRLQGTANWIGQIAWITVPWFYAIMYSERLFEGPVQGARILAIAVGIFIVLGGIVPAIFTREYFGSQPKNETRKGFMNNLREFFKGFVITFKCLPFVKLCAATFLIFNGFQLGSSFSLYVMIYYVFGGDNTNAGILQGWLGTVTSICTFGVIPLAAWISTKVGKKRALLLTISLSLVGYALKWVGYNPNYPYLLLIAAPFVAFGIGSLFTLICAMVADVCDYDELKTGRRREGMFGAIYWWMVKIGMSVAGLLTGLMLNASGFNVALGSAQPIKTLFFLRVFDVGTTIITSLIAILIIATFDITEEKAHDIRLELEKRRGKPAGESVSTNLVVS
ncbi:MAG: sugar:proton symporter [Planctomycetes bacterium GWF2_41_51]|nr:MAG: sugar:proton symporter [Planctomycetes bacterium GWF2_41_51]HBG26803.1 MFS transporter [Phycisphaerales bacterium]